MELTRVLIYYLVHLGFSKGFKISKKLNFDGEAVVVSDLLNVKFNETRNDVVLLNTDRREGFDAKIPLIVGKKNDIDVKIPVTAEGSATPPENKAKFLGELRLFERGNTDSSGKNSLQIVAGTLNDIKPDFLISVPYVPTMLHSKPRMTKNYSILNLWSDGRFHERKSGLEELKSPVQPGWILNNILFLGAKRNETSRPANHKNKGPDPFVWYVLESSTWNPRDPVSWIEEQKIYWIQKEREWSDLKPNNVDHPKYDPENKNLF